MLYTLLYYCRRLAHGGSVEMVFSHIRQWSESAHVQREVRSILFFICLQRIWRWLSMLIIFQCGLMYMVGQISSHLYWSGGYDWFFPRICRHSKQVGCIMYASLKVHSAEFPLFCRFIKSILCHSSWLMVMYFLKNRINKKVFSMQCSRCAKIVINL